VCVTIEKQKSHLSGGSFALPNFAPLVEVNVISLGGKRLGSETATSNRTIRGGSNGRTSKTLLNAGVENLNHRSHVGCLNVFHFLSLKDFLLLINIFTKRL